MIPAVPSTSSQPLPGNLKSQLPNPQTPWNVSSPLFSRIQAQASDQPFKLCEVLSSDPDFNFILKYFEHQKPPGYSIKRVVCIHNPDHTQMFESTLKNMEREAGNPVFAPKGKDEEPKTDRARVLARWETQASQFSPVEIKSSNSRQPDKCSKAKVLPLWHGSSPEVCQSVCTSGFTYFGKQHYFDESASKGNTHSTDKGYFGSGIYFTNSAQYASKYSLQGCLILAWVSMREPYPVVNDKPHPEEGSDMKKLKGQKHYQNYNAHLIPVASIRPQDPQCLIYYPCYKDQPPAWDEFVVFEKAQTLPRFWIEVGVDFPKVALSDLETAGELLTLLLSLLDKPEVQNHVALSQMLQAKANLMLEQAETHPLGLEEQKFLKLAKRLQPEGEKLSNATVSMLLKMGASSPPTPPAAAPVKVSSPPLSVVSLVPVLPSVATLAPVQLKAPVKPAVPSIAFGKELWEKYLGDVGEEPPLPSDIQQILQSPCPFFPGKKVEETHLLTLISKTVNGKPLTLDSLEELVKHPKQGQATKYSYYWDGIKKEYGSQSLSSSYWVLMTRDVIPESRNKRYDVQKQLLESYSQKAHVPYEVPHLLEVAVSIFMEYLKTGRMLYSDNPETYTWCQERVSIYPTYALVVGGFAAGGLYVNSNIAHEDSGLGGLRKFNDQGITQDSKETTPNISLEMKPALHTIPPVNPPLAAASAKTSSSFLPIVSLSPVLPKLSVKSILPTIAFGKELWAKYLGDVGEEPFLPSNIQQILQSTCPFFPDKKVEETHLLTLIPKTVNGKLLTLNTLEGLVKHPKQGQATKYAHYWYEIEKQYGSQSLSSSYWVLMTRDVIPESRNKSYDAQKQLLESYRQKAHVPYEIPHLLEAAVSILMEYLQTGKRLYSDNPLTLTRCQERVSRHPHPTWPLFVGGFAAGGLIFTSNNPGVHECYGVGGLRKF
jgi:hypothetical protein